jgi:Protein of unknown function (DUF742)
MTRDEHDWLDAEAGPVVRPYAVSSGRAAARPGGWGKATPIDLVAFVHAVDDTSTGMFLLPEHQAILDRAKTPVTVAELAGHLDLAVGVVRVLLDDLLQQRLISINEPDGAGRPDERVLKAVINGLRAL